MKRQSTLNHVKVLFTIGCILGMVFSGTTLARNNPPDPLIIASGVDATILDPPRMTGQVTQNMLFHIFDRLVGLDAKGNFIPILAKSWELKNPTTLVMHLRDDVTFSNGEKFTAEDVKFSLERYTDPNLPGKTLAKTLQSTGQLSGVEVIDDYTVALKTKAPAPLLIPVLVRYCIMPKAYYTSTDLETLVSKPVGSGPYILKEWIKDEKLVMEANENYWLGKPTIKTVIWRSIPETGTRISELVTGNVHIVSDVPPDLINSIKTDKSRVSATAGLRLMYTGIVTNDPNLPTSDKRVRQAMNYAIDKKAITDSIFHGMTKPFDSLFPDAFANPDVKAYPYDPKKAKALLKEAGYPNGFTIEMASPNGRNLKDVEVAQVVATYLQQVGIKVKFNAYDWVTYSRLMKSKKAEWKLYFMGQGGWVTMLQNLARTFDVRQSPWALHAWAPEKFVQLFDEASTEANPEKHKALMWEAEQLIWDECPWIFLYKQPLIYGVSKDLNWDIWPTGQVVLHWTVLPALQE
ncbi:MAG: hypothetical protein HKM93_16125 [Desulfobacteraceae bacterium]|nr:hypothetical protein [Desulfobacteraceae bacterium]